MSAKGAVVLPAVWCRLHAEEQILIWLGGTVKCSV